MNIQQIKVAAEYFTQLKNPITLILLRAIAERPGKSEEVMKQTGVRMSRERFFYHARILSNLKLIVKTGPKKNMTFSVDPDKLDWLLDITSDPESPANLQDAGRKLA